VGGVAAVRQRLFSRFYAEASFGYDNIQYTDYGAQSSPSILRDDNYFYGRLALGYEFNRHVIGSLFYNYYRDNSSYTPYSYDDSVLGLNITWRP